MANVKTQPLNGQSRTSPVRGFVGQAAEVTGDVIELAELQVQLVKADAEDAIQRALRPITMIATAGVIVLGSLPILLLAIAGLIAKYTDIEIALAQLFVGLVVILVAVIIAAVSVRKLKSSLAPFSRSAAELQQNLAWLKTIFRSSNS